MIDKLTVLEAYKAMYAFLDTYYNQTGHPDEIGLILGDLRILENGKTVDPAAWQDWLSAVEKALEMRNES